MGTFLLISLFIEALNLGQPPPPRSNTTVVKYYSSYGLGFQIVFTGRGNFCFSNEMIISRLYLQLFPFTSGMRGRNVKDTENLER